MKYYTSLDDTDNYQLVVDMWDGEAYVSWVRPVSKELGFRALGQGAYEYPGSARIKDQPFFRTPSFVSLYYDASGCLYSKKILSQNPKLRSLAGDTITIETVLNKFEISKKTGILKKIDFYNPNQDNKMIIWKTYELSDHVECSGVWMPLRVVITERGLDERVVYKGEISVDPQTLRLLDTIEDASIFNEMMPAGCLVDDQIRKKIYIVTTADTLPNDVEALRKALERMAEQVLEQKEEAEMWEKRKKK